MRPGAPSRRGEADEMEPTLRRHFAHLERIETPGTVDAGDIMMVGRHFYIGLSARTSAAGAGQLIELLSRYQLTGSLVDVRGGLHLKSTVSYLENNFLVATALSSALPEFSRFDIIRIPDDEQYAANCLWINGTVLVADGFPKTRGLVEAAGFPTIVLDVSEFRKLDGGLSCLSLRF
jgi:dimethylargininase